MKRAGWAGGGAAGPGGGGAAGNLERPLKPKEWFFLINSKCHFSGRRTRDPCGPLLSLCVLLSGSLVLVTIEITDEMVAAECVCSAIGGWVLSCHQQACGVRSLPLTARQRCEYAVWKIEISQHQKMLQSSSWLQNVLYCSCPQIRAWKLMIFTMKILSSLKG